MKPRKNTVTIRMATIQLELSTPAFSILLLTAGFIAGFALTQFISLDCASFHGAQQQLEKVLSGGRGDPRLAPARGQEEAEEEEKKEDSSQLVIGVMTTRVNLTTRAAAIWATWGRDSPASVLFYVGQDEALSSGAGNKTRNASHRLNHIEEVGFIAGLPVVQLEGVSDQTYPPRAKSFAMLRHLHLRFGRSARWYLRADDDLYVRPEKLVRYLLSMDDTRPWYLGQPGFGVPREIGHLGLKPGQPFCMGGPGVVFSSAALGLLVPHLEECTRHVVTPHEDTELGRCVWRHLMLACTNSERMKLLFYQNYDKGGYTSMRNKHYALTVHPVKNPADMHRLHVVFAEDQMEELFERRERLETMAEDVSDMIEESAEDEDTHDKRREAEVFVERRLAHRNRGHGLSKANGPAADVGESSAADDEEMETLTLEVLREDNPLWGFAVLNKHAVEMQARNERVWQEDMLYRVTHDLVLFTTAHESEKLQGERICARYQSFTLVHGLRYVFSFRYGGFWSFLVSSAFEEELEWREIGEHVHPEAKKGAVKQREVSFSKGRSPQARTAFRGDISPPTQTERTPPQPPWPRLSVLLPLYGRYKTYLRFLDHLGAAASSYPAGVNLRVALYPDPGGEHKLSLTASRRLNRLGSLNITVLECRPPFSRAVALNVAAAGTTFGTVLVMLDVDVAVSVHFLLRAALTAHYGTAYFPVVFSQYSPLTTCYNRPVNCTPALSDFSAEAGLWRYHSYGVLAVTEEDFRRTKGYNSTIKGWGKEDLMFYERCISRGIEVFRAPDTGLIHMYHDRLCDPELPKDQLRMCNGSREVILGSIAKMAEVVTTLNLSET